MAATEDLGIENLVFVVKVEFWNYVAGKASDPIVAGIWNVDRKDLIREDEGKVPVGHPFLVLVNLHGEVTVEDINYLDIMMMPRR